MLGTRAQSRLLGTAACALALAAATPAAAQQPAPAPAPAPTQATPTPVPGEIIVTARRREESILKVPVVVTAISEQKLQNLQTTQMTDLPKLVPGLILGNNILSIGTQVAIRGVGTSASDAGVDSSVSLNVDGLAM